MAIETVIQPPQRTRGLVRFALVVTVVASVRCAVEIVSFIENVRRPDALIERCRADVPAGLQIHLLTGYSRASFQSFVHIWSGGYHAYAGPGGAFLQIGVGDVVIDLRHPRCS